MADSLDYPANHLNFPTVNGWTVEEVRLKQCWGNPCPLILSQFQVASVVESKSILLQEGVISGGCDLRKGMISGQCEFRRV